MGRIRDLWVPAEERGRILGDRGSNVKKVVEILRAELGHIVGEHGRPPFVQFDERDGYLQFELELYWPFNNEESFDQLVGPFKVAVNQLRDEPTAAGSLHCKRPPRIQPDDWECPNRQCGNLCFSRRNKCPRCGAAKPQDNPAMVPRLSRNVPDTVATEELARPPKHKMELVSTAERLGAPKRGECQVVWLVPEDKRGYVIGKRGSTILRIKSEAGVDLILTQSPETRSEFGINYCMAFLRGTPECVREAVSMVSKVAKGRLGRDGFELLLHAVERALEDSEHAALCLGDLARDLDVQDQLEVTQSLRCATGFEDLVETLSTWPEKFAVWEDENLGIMVQMAKNYRPPESADARVRASMPRSPLQQPEPAADHGGTSMPRPPLQQLQLFSEEEDEEELAVDEVDGDPEGVAQEDPFDVFAKKQAFVPSYLKGGAYEVYERDP